MTTKTTVRAHLFFSLFRKTRAIDALLSRIVLLTSSVAFEVPNARTFKCGVKRLYCHQEAVKRGALHMASLFSLFVLVVINFFKGHIPAIITIDGP